MVITEEGALPFQRYFVGLQCAPVVKRLEFRNAERAKASSQVVGGAAAIRISPPSSFAPRIPISASIRSWRCRISARRSTKVTAPIVAVSPLIGGQAVKGPTAKIMAELGVPADSASIARHYPFHRWPDHRRSGPRGGRQASTLPVRVTSTFMRSLEDRDRLAADCLDFARQPCCGRAEKDGDMTSAADRPNIWAIVPVKRLSLAKAAACAGAVAQRARRTGAHHAARRADHAVRDAGAGGNIVVSGDPAVAKLATLFDARVVGDIVESGVNAAVQQGLEDARSVIRRRAGHSGRRAVRNCSRSAGRHRRTRPASDRAGAGTIATAEPTRSPCAART